jgi:hypothetical protein
MKIDLMLSMKVIRIGSSGDEHNEQIQMKSSTHW